MAGAIDIKYNKVRNPQLREFIEKDFHDELFNVDTGHNHDGVNSPILSPSAVIENNSIISAKIVDGAVTTDKLGADAVIGTKIADNAVDSEHIAAGAIDTAHIGDAQVTNAKLDDLARGSIKVGGADDAVTDLVAKTDGYILIGDGTDLNSVAVSGDVTIANTGEVTIANNAVDTVHLSAITTPTARAITDPGTGKAIPVTGNGNVALTLAGAGETNTLAVPTFAGQILTISADTVAASAARTVTVASAINATGNNTLTFDTAGGFISLYGIKLGETFAWRVLASDGVTLSTVA